MKGFTLKPHWAHGIAWLGKPIENRSWPIPASMIGQRIAIHAGSEAGFKTPWLNELDACIGGAVARRAAFGPLVPVVDNREGPSHLRLVQSRAIVATAVLARCLPNDGNPPSPWAFKESKYWWVLEDVQTLSTPVRVSRGQLGFWGLPKATEALVRIIPTFPAHRDQS